MLKYPQNKDARSAEQIARIARGMFLIGQMGEISASLDWIRSERDRLSKESCTESDEKTMYRMQGAVLMISDLLEKVSSARKVRDRVDSNFHLHDGNRGAV